jgi:hypothetical protein
VPYRPIGHAERRIDDIILDSGRQWGLEAAGRYDLTPTASTQCRQFSIRQRTHTASAKATASREADEAARSWTRATLSGYVPVREWPPGSPSHVIWQPSTCMSVAANA